MEKGKMNEAVAGTMEDQSQAPTAEATTQHSSWTEGDELWSAKLSAVLIPAARRHGRACFQCVMQAGVAGEAVALIHKRTGGNAELTKALQVLGNILDHLLQHRLKAEGISGEAFMACKQEVELVGSLAGHEAQGLGASKIIVPTRH